MNKVRMRVLESFTRRLDNQIIVGDPSHPDEEGRIIHVSENAADVLEDEGLAEAFSEKDQAREELETEKRGTSTADTGGAADGLKPGAVKEVVKALTSGTERKSGRKPVDTLDPNKRETAQAARERRIDTSRSETGGRRRAPSKRGAPSAGERGGAPVGGNETTASTNHPTSSVDGGGIVEETNKGSSGTPDPDAAPTE